MFEQDLHWAHFKRLREEDPVHENYLPKVGRYWSITKFEDRRMLTRWSDVATAAPRTGVVESEEQRRTELLECLAYFTKLWNERSQMENPGSDLISMLAHGEDTKDMQPMEFLGNLVLLIVGGNDTTRNSISGGVLALNQNPAEYDKLRNDLSLIPNMVSEIIRWQTPLPYMRRTANEDIELRGKKIKAGEQLLMWYVSGNRDEDVIDRPDEFLIDRKGARHPGLTRFFSFQTGTN